MCKGASLFLLAGQTVSLSIFDLYGKLRSCQSYLGESPELSSLSLHGLSLIRLDMVCMVTFITLLALFCLPCS